MPDLPALPGGLTARPLTADDVDAVAALLAAAETVDDTGEHWSAEDLTEMWANERVDVPRDGIAARTGDGAVVAFATAIAPPTFRDAFGVYLEGRVHPGRRGEGVGRALLDWQLARAAEVHAERHPEAPARLTVVVPQGMPGLAALAQRRGLTAVRRYRQMTRPLTGLPAPRGVPGVDLVPFDWARDDEVRRAHNAAFTEHHGSSERDADSWRLLFTGRRSFRPDLSVLALADGAVVSYALVYVHESDTAATGVAEAHLGQIGTLPGARGRGLASAAVVAALHTAAAAGCGQAGLHVDSENVTGAPRLYEGLGFRDRRTLVSWSLALPPQCAR